VKPGWVCGLFLYGILRPDISHLPMGHIIGVAASRFQHIGYPAGLVPYWDRCGYGSSVLPDLEIPDHDSRGAGSTPWEDEFFASFCFSYLPFGCGFPNRQQD
jgi:hypothetical protein